MALTKVSGDLIKSSAMSMVVGCNCENNSGTPSTLYDLDADAVVLRASDGSSVVRFNPGAAISNNVETAGPAANGRDQAGAFSADSWIHFYWIWNGSTLATLSSATAPPTGPTLPSGYTHWAYAGAVRFNGSSQLYHTYIKGSWAYYQAMQNVLSAGVSTTEAAIDVSSLVPPNALSWKGMVSKGVTTNVNQVLWFRLVTGVVTRASILNANPGSHSFEMEMPNVGQSVLYEWDNAPSVGIDLDITAFRIPNGGE